MKFNDAFAPPNWDYEKYGRPDVVFMAWCGYLDGESADDAAYRAANRVFWKRYEPGSRYFDDYKEAQLAARAVARGAGDHRSLDPKQGAPVDGAGDQRGSSASPNDRGLVAQRRDTVEAVARNVADQLGVDTKSIEFSDDSPTFELNGKTLRAAGFYYPRGVVEIEGRRYPSGGFIRLFHPALSHCSLLTTPMLTIPGASPWPSSARRSRGGSASAG
ncbi:MAG: hypothetical protein IT536_01695 [Hyphomicrobiales bacterium]|nr:hypothetical protein [Hyphomicrobiales bacterium]